MLVFRLARPGRRRGRASVTAPREVAIAGDTIRLGQLLKFAGIVGSGTEARALVQDGAVRVNGDVERRRGRQLRRGDLVDAEGEQVRVG